VSDVQRQVGHTSCASQAPRTRLRTAPAARTGAAGAGDKRQEEETPWGGRAREAFPETAPPATRWRGCAASAPQGCNRCGLSAASLLGPISRASWGDQVRRPRKGRSARCGKATISAAAPARRGPAFWKMLARRGCRGLNRRPRERFGSGIKAAPAKSWPGATADGTMICCPCGQAARRGWTGSGSPPRARAAGAADRVMKPRSGPSSYSRIAAPPRHVHRGRRQPAGERDGMCCRWGRRRRRRRSPPARLGGIAGTLARAPGKPRVTTASRGICDELRRRGDRGHGHPR